MNKRERDQIKEWEDRIARINLVLLGIVIGLLLAFVLFTGLACEKDPKSFYPDAGCPLYVADDGSTFDTTGAPIQDEDGNGIVDDSDCPSYTFPICHIPKGNPDNLHTICVEEEDIEAHINHGDYEGGCEE